MGGLSSERERVDPERLARLPEFYAPRVSPDGDELAFFHDLSGRMELYTLSLARGGDGRSAGGEGTRDAADRGWEQWSDADVPTNLSGPVLWDRGADRLLFHRDEDGDEQNDLRAIDRSGEQEPVIEVEGQVYLAAVTGDGRLVYCADRNEQMNLHVYDPPADGRRGDGGTHRQLTDHDRPVWPWDVELGPDGERVTYTTNETRDPENTDAYVLDLETGDSRRLDVGETGSEASIGGWFPDGERLLVGDDAPDLPRVGVYDLREDTVSWLASDAHEKPVAVSPDGDRAVVVRTREAATMPVVYDTETGADRTLDVPEGVAGPVGGEDGGFLPDGRLALVHMTGTDRKTVVAYDLGNDAVETVLPAEYGDVDPSVFVEPEYVTYESEDGLEIGALLYEPEGRDATAGDGEGFPAVVKIHGGPTGQSKRRFDLLAQTLAAAGYVVLDPNYRGSTGRGREFRNRIREDWGGMEQVDVRRGAEWLAERGTVDRDRIAAFGVSYGGYSTYCQLTMHPEPWAAGVAWVGMTDLQRLHEESMPHMQSLLEDHLGDPEENVDRYRERSPVEHVENVEAPIGVLHGVNDPRCPVSQARLFRDALAEEGLEEGEDGDFEYVELGEEGHGSTDVEQRVRAFGHVTDFLDRRLRNH